MMDLDDACEKLAEYIQGDTGPASKGWVIQRFVTFLSSGETPGMALAACKNTEIHASHEIGSDIRADAWIDQQEPESE